MSLQVSGTTGQIAIRHTWHASNKTASIRILTGLSHSWAIAVRHTWHASQTASIKILTGFPRWAIIITETLLIRYTTCITEETHFPQLY